MTQTEHGVFLDIFGLGTLIAGPSGIGKSEIALGLINQGHRLVADDTVEFYHSEDGKIIGQCPNLLQDFLEIRGLGILNIRAMYGDIAIKKDKGLHFIINIFPSTDEIYNHIDRLHGMHTTKTVLDQEIQQVSIPISAGRNMTVLIECAVRDQLLRGKGYIASEIFVARQQEAIARSES